MAVKSCVGSLNRNVWHTKTQVDSVNSTSQGGSLSTVPIDFDAEDCVLLEQEDVVQAMAFYIAEYLRQNAKLHRMDAKHLRHGLDVAFKIAKEEETVKRRSFLLRWPTFTQTRNAMMWLPWRALYAAPTSALPLGGACKLWLWLLTQLLTQGYARPVAMALMCIMFGVVF